MPDLVRSIKKAAMDAYRNSDPTCLMFGKVIQISPLKIQVNQKLFLTEKQLILTRNVTDYTLKIEIDLESDNALGNHQHDISLNTENALGEHQHDISLNTENALGNHKHSYSGKTETGANIPSGTIPVATLNHTHQYSGDTNNTDLTHNHSVTGNTNNSNLTHNHTVSGNTSDTNLKHKHTIKGIKEITVKNALQVGEKVIMIRQDGGQEYIVLDRVG